MNHFARRATTTTGGNVSAFACRTFTRRACATAGAAARMFAAVFALALALAAIPGIAAADADADYAALLARAKQSTDGVDFRALRDAYALTSRYEPYGGAERELEGAMFKAFNAKECGEATQHARAITERNYVHIHAHMVLDMCLARTDPPRAPHHEAIVRGLLRSILDAGDGKSPQTAWPVITVAEEYALLNVLGLRKDKQSLIRADGHVYDRLDTRDAKGNVEVRYFNIDRLFAREMQKR